MADRKISQLTNLTGANLADNDEFAVVDTSATETKAITFGELKTALDTSTGFVRITGDTMTGDLNLSGADVTFGDNDKAIFGAGSDLQIYHDGLNSYIDDQGTGRVYIRASDQLRLQASDGENYALFAANGAAQFYYDNSQKLATTATGINVTGTVVSDGLTVDGNITLNGSNMSLRMFESDTTDLNTQIQTNVGKLSLKTVNDAVSATKNRLEIDHATGDISFYEDTGTTPKFFWDASAEVLEVNKLSALGDQNTKLDFNIANTARIFAGGLERMRITNSGNVGIGTSSPTKELHVQAASNPEIRVRNSDNNYALDLGVFGTTGTIKTSAEMAFYPGGIERARFDASGNLGIGTSSPSTKVDIKQTTDNAFSGIRIERSTTSNQYSVLSSAQGTTYLVGVDLLGAGNNVLSFGNSTNGTTYSERMRIDSSGNLLVGKTSSDNGATAGFEAQPDGDVAIAKSGRPLIVNRLSSDGDIVDFRKNGSTIGSVGVTGGNFYIDGASGFQFRSVDILPRSSGVSSDASIDLGRGVNRFKDLYLSGGVYLGGTGSANYLDDYEEGTWTPAYAFGTSGSAATSVTNAYYVKIGKMVQISFQIATASISSPVGDVTITGLPFTCSNQTNNRSGFAIGFAFRWGTDMPNLRVSVINNQNYLRLYKNATNADPAVLVQGSDFTSGNNYNYIYVSGTYQTT